MPDERALLAQAMAQSMGQFGGNPLMPFGQQRPVLPEVLQQAPNVSEIDYGSGQDFAKGMAAGTLGMPADISNLVIELANANPMWQDIEARVPYGSEQLGEQFGADTSSPAFKGGTIGTPDLTDLGKLGGTSLAAMLFHGSPHKFDRFALDADKVGTGSGAQAQGHGLYFAEQRKVGETYKDDTQKGFSWKNLSGHGAELPDEAWDEISPIMQRHNIPGDISPDQSQPGRIREMLEEYGNGLSPEEVAVFERYASPPGHLYEADVPDELLPRMIDWDRPMSEQPENVKSVMREEFASRGIDFDEWAAQGGDWSDARDNVFEEVDQVELSKLLNSKGIPGVRYLDADSRDASTRVGEGTRNVVLFDEDPIRSVKRDDELVYQKEELAKQLSRQQDPDFDNNYSYHVDLRGREAGNAQQNLQSIREVGFNSGSLNVVPASMASDPSPMASQYQPRPGDVVYVVPNEALGKTGSGRPSVREGWRPDTGEGVAVEIQEGESLYDAYQRTLAGPDPERELATALANRPAPQDVPIGKITAPGPEVSTMEKRVGTTGKYRGAPRHVDTPAKLSKMRKELARLLETGTPGRNWYDQSSESARSLTADRPGLRDRYAANIAITSSDTSVPANAGFAIKGFNQQAAGDPVFTGRYPQAMSERVKEATGGEDYTLANKTGPFFEAVTVPPGGNPEIRPTNDLWMARAFDFTELDEAGQAKPWTSGLGTAQHRFMDDEIRKLTKLANDRAIGGHTDWTPERVQAAIWVAKKSEWEGTSIERAATDFSSDLERRSVNITAESQPSTELNHMQGVLGSQEGAQRLYDLQNAAFTDEAGRDLFSVHAGALTRPSMTGGGTYGAEANPVQVSPILGAQDTASSGMDPSTRKLAEHIAAMHGLTKGQETVGINFLAPPKGTGEINAAVGGPIDPAALEQSFGGSVIPTPSSEGTRYLDVGGNFAEQEKRKEMARLLGASKLGDVDFRANSGNLVGNLEGTGYKPSAYLPYLDEHIGETMDPFTRWSAGTAERIDTALFDTVPDPGTRNAILQRTREALSQGGIAEVKRLVEAGVLPAVVLGVLGAGSLADTPEATQTGGA